MKVLFFQIPNVTIFQAGAESRTFRKTCDFKAQAFRSIQISQGCINSQLDGTAFSIDFHGDFGRHVQLWALSKVVYRIGIRLGDESRPLSATRDEAALYTQVSGLVNLTVVLCGCAWGVERVARCVCGIDDFIAIFPYLALAIGEEKFCFIREVKELVAKKTNIGQPVFDVLPNLDEELFKWRIGPNESVLSGVGVIHIPHANGTFGFSVTIIEDRARDIIVLGQRRNELAAIAIVEVVLNHCQIFCLVDLNVFSRAIRVAVFKKFTL